MAATSSNMTPLGTIAPDFDLPDVVTGSNKNLQTLKGVKGTVVMFICNHCPYVLHIKKPLTDIANRYIKEGVNIIAINSNDIENYPQDAPEKMKQMMEQWRNPFVAYLYDETQEVAKAYHAACTPDIYVFDTDLVCVYHGRFDASTPKNDVPVTGMDLRRALDDLLAGKPASGEQLHSIGCNIKWKEA